MTLIVGNDDLKSRLSNDILAGTLPHACIIEGPRGTGKHTVARMCAAALACSQKHDSSKPIPCLECPECKKVLEGKSPDLIFVGTEDKATIGVETVRFLREDVRVVPNDLDYKIYVIEDADKMTVQAQNALLLTLEEPPEYVRFFLLCENARLLLETIRSRAPIHRTEPLDTKQIDEYLCAADKRAAQMKLTAKKEYGELLKAAGVGIGCALEYLDPKRFAPILERRRLALEFVSTAVHASGSLSVLSAVFKFPQKRDALRDQLMTVSDAIRDLILLKKSDSAPLVFFVDRNEAIELCDRVSLPFLFRLGECVREAIDDNARNANVRLALTRLASSAEII
jgi:DNA polymerase-3 subunit delta'